MAIPSTVSKSWVQTVLIAATRHGVDQAELLASAGIKESDLAEERLPIDHMTRLWHAAAKLTHDASFGLRVGSVVGAASFNVVGFILQSSRTLREAIGLVQKYQRLISDGGSFQLLGGAGSSWVVYHPRQGVLAFSPHQIEAVLAALVAFAGWVRLNGIHPRLVRISHARVGPMGEYFRVFGCPVEFEQAYNGVLLDNALLDEPLPQADAQLSRLHEQYAAARISALSQAHDPRAAVLSWIMAHFGPPLPNRAEAAAALDMSERTLARRLRSSGTSFSQLLDDARRDQAMRAIGTTQRALGEIAHSLGFAEISPFYRAFRRWTGVTPAQWRERQSR